LGNTRLTKRIKRVQKENKVKVQLLLLPIAIIMIPLYIFLHESGHAIVAIMCGAENVRISILTASMSSDFIEHTPFTRLLMNTAGMLFPVIIFSTIALFYNPRKTNILYRCFYYCIVPITIAPVFAWVLVPVIGMLFELPPGDDVTKFITNSGWHPSVVIIAALTLIALLILLFYLKGIFRLYKVKL